MLCQATEERLPAKTDFDSRSGLQTKPDFSQGESTGAGVLADNISPDSTTPAMVLSEPDVQNMIAWQAAENRLPSAPDDGLGTATEAREIPPANDTGESKKKIDIMRFFKMRGGAGA